MRICVLIQKVQHSLFRTCCKRAPSSWMRLESLELDRASVSLNKNAAPPCSLLPSSSSALSILGQKPTATEHELAAVGSGICESCFSYAASFCFRRTGVVEINTAAIRKHLFVFPILLLWFNLVAVSEFNVFRMGTVAGSWRI